jgi:hypothetical protein
VFGPTRKQVVEGWRRLHNEKLHNLYTSHNIIRVITSMRVRWVEHIARIREMKNLHNILVGNPEGKRRFGRPRRRWEDNIRMDSREIDWEGVDWIM